MSNEIAANQESLIPANLSVSKFGDAEAFGAVAKSSGKKWLPYLTLFQSSSDAVKERKIEMAHWGITKSNEIEDLGESVDVLVVSQRPKAMLMGEGGSPVTYFNFRSDEFLKIQEKADKDGFDGGASYGPEFLLWIPSVGKFCTLFLNSATAKNSYVDLKARLGKAATLGSRYIKSSKYSWYGPVFTKCSTPIVMPDPAELELEANTFNNPEDSNIEFNPEKLEERAR